MFDPPWLYGIYAIAAFGAWALIALLWLLARELRGRVSFGDHARNRGSDEHALIVEQPVQADKGDVSQIAYWLDQVKVALQAHPTVRTVYDGHRPVDVNAPHNHVIIRSMSPDSPSRGVRAELADRLTRAYETSVPEVRVMRISGADRADTYEAVFLGDGVFCPPESGPVAYVEIGTPYFAGKDPGLKGNWQRPKIIGDNGTHFEAAWHVEQRALAIAPGHAGAPAGIELDDTSQNAALNALLSQVVVVLNASNDKHDEPVKAFARSIGDASSGLKTSTLRPIAVDLLAGSAPSSSGEDFLAPFVRHNINIWVPSERNEPTKTPIVVPIHLVERNGNWHRVSLSDRKKRGGRYLDIRGLVLPDVGVSRDFGAWDVLFNRGGLLRSSEMQRVDRTLLDRRHFEPSMFVERDTRKGYQWKSGNQRGQSNTRTFNLASNRDVVLSFQEREEFLSGLGIPARAERSRTLNEMFKEVLPKNLSFLRGASDGELTTFEFDLDPHQTDKGFVLVPDPSDHPAMLSPRGPSTANPQLSLAWLDRAVRLQNVEGEDVKLSQWMLGHWGYVVEPTEGFLRVTILRDGAPASQQDSYEIASGQTGVIGNLVVHYRHETGDGR